MFQLQKILIPNKGKSLFAATLKLVLVHYKWTAGDFRNCQDKKSSFPLTCILPYYMLEYFPLPLTILQLMMMYLAALLSMLLS